MVNRYNSFRGAQRGGRAADGGCPICSNERNTCNMAEARQESGGCAGGDCKALMKRLQKIDFSIVDVTLYLDIYPECKEALAFYQKLVSERETIRRTLSHKCKRPMSSYENGAESWDWISSPWPWEASAN